MVVCTPKSGGSHFFKPKIFRILFSFVLCKLLRALIPLTRWKLFFENNIAILSFHRNFDSEMHLIHSLYQNSLSCLENSLLSIIKILHSNKNLSDSFHYHSHLSSFKISCLWWHFWSFCLESWCFIELAPDFSETLCMLSSLFALSEATDFCILSQLFCILWHWER